MDSALASTFSTASVADAVTETRFGPFYQFTHRHPSPQRGEGGILSKEDIIIARRRGAIRIVPFREQNLTTCSYDVTLSNVGWYTRKPNSKIDISDPQSFHEALEFNDPALERAGFGTEGVTLEPHSAIWAVTDEFIGTAPGSQLNAELRARSTLTRAGLSISASGGWGDVGYRSRWWMMIVNHTSSLTFIPFGTRVGQIIFHAVINGNGADSSSYQSLSGNYSSVSESTNETYEELCAEWKVSSFLPKLPSMLATS